MVQPSQLGPESDGNHEAAIASEARYRGLFDASPDAIILTDLQTRILMCNRQAAALWGPGSPESLIGRNALEFIAPEDHERAMANAQKTLESGSVHSIEYTLLREDGSRFAAELSASLIVDHQGAPQAFTAVVRDITDRKRLESELRRAERLRSLGVMAAGVAHHINNVLAGVLGQADVLLETTEDETSRQRLRTIVQAAQDGAAAVHRIKQFAYEQSAETLHRIDVSLLVREVVEATESRLEGEAGRRGGTIDIVTSVPGPLFVLGVEAELRDALANVVLNSIDALPTGGTISVELAEHDRQAVLQVSDTGSGMSSETLERIYDPFFTTKPLGEGTGLGLAMTYGIVQRHGGQVEVRSRPGHGTTVELLFPLAPDFGRAELKTQSGKHPRGLNILVVDDEPFLAEQLHVILTLDAHRVRIANRGVDALAALRQERFDVVITDLGMPDVDGWMVAREAKARIPDVRVGIVTERAGQVPNMDDGQQRVVDFVIARPYSVQIVREAIAEAIG